VISSHDADSPSATLAHVSFTQGFANGATAKGKHLIDPDWPTFE
jgi:hypothetical protein